MRFKNTIAFAVPLAAITLTLAHAPDASAITLSGVTLQGPGLGRYWNTLGGDAGYNLYLSQNGGTTFLNSGDTVTTSVNLLLVPGNNTFQFFGDSTSDPTLALALFFDGTNSTPRITAGTNTGASASAFTPYSANVRDVSSNVVAGSGTVVYSAAGTTITLTSFFYGAGSDTVSPFSTVGNGASDEVGGFTLNVTVVPEAGSLALVEVGIALAGIGVVRRKRAGAVA